VAELWKKRGKERGEVTHGAKEKELAISDIPQCP
jgi:hypothetical protein